MFLKFSDKNCDVMKFLRLKRSVADPLHFDMDLDPTPANRSGSGCVQIRILIFSDFFFKRYKTRTMDFCIYEIVIHVY